MHLINTHLAVVGVVGNFVKALSFGIPEVLTAVVVVTELVVMTVVRVVVAATVVGIVECTLVVATIE